MTSGIFLASDSSLKLKDSILAMIFVMINGCNSFLAFEALIGESKAIWLNIHGLLDYNISWRQLWASMFHLVLWRFNAHAPYRPPLNIPHDPLNTPSGLDPSQTFRIFSSKIEKKFPTWNPALIQHWNRLKFGSQKKKS